MNPTMKESFEKGEDVAFWMKEKTGNALAATRLDQPLKQIDSKAAKSLEEMENIRQQVSFLKS